MIAAINDDRFPIIAQSLPCRLMHLCRPYSDSQEDVDLRRVFGCVIIPPTTKDTAVEVSQLFCTWNLGSDPKARGKQGETKFPSKFSE